MMSLSEGNLKNLAQGNEECALRALIHAIIPEAASGTRSGDAVAKLTEKLTQLMGPEAAQEFEQTRNKRGELVNEEGLPIIDISEPIDTAPLSMPPPISVEPLIPLADLPHQARERLRDRRNRILDLLEQEEQQADLLEKQRESQERDEILRKRREQAVGEKDKIKEARELQKKMGRALLQNMGKAKENEEKEKEAQRLRDEEADKRRSPSIKKKTVAFVENLEKLEEPLVVPSKSADWGDLTPARLQGSKRPTLMSQALLDRHPMKMSVVERVPGGQPTLSKTSHPSQQALDSDDESDPGDFSDSSETDVRSDDEEPVLEHDEIDFDFAQHQREIALEYYMKRNSIGQETAEAMMSHSHDLNKENGIASETPREISKPAISQFRATRIASAYNASTPTSTDSSSTSLGASVLPASSTRTIQRAIRTGKLDIDGKLVRAEVDSASEEEGMQEVLDLLRKGEVYNIGPEGQYLHTIPPGQTGQVQVSIPPSSNHVEEQKPLSPLPPPSMRSKTSKFKASRAPSSKLSNSNPISISDPPPFEIISPSITPISNAARSSPKSVTPPSTTPVVNEKPGGVQTGTLAKSPQKFSMIVDSASFPMPHESRSAHLQPSAPPMPPMSISSPSFPPTRSSTRLDRPPTVVATTVREFKRLPPPENTPQDQPERKVSRFKAERM